MQIYGRTLLVRIKDISKGLITPYLRVIGNYVPCCHKTFCSIVVLQ